MLNITKYVSDYEIAEILKIAEECELKDVKFNYFLRKYNEFMKNKEYKDGFE
jgi:hypothetical protein